LILAIIAALVCACVALYCLSSMWRLARDLNAQHEAVLVLADALTEAIVERHTPWLDSRARAIVDAAVRRVHEARSA